MEHHYSSNPKPTQNTSQSPAPIPTNPLNNKTKHSQNKTKNPQNKAKNPQIKTRNPQNKTNNPQIKTKTPQTKPKNSQKKTVKSQIKAKNTLTFLLNKHICLCLFYMLVQKYFDHVQNVLTLFNNF